MTKENTEQENAPPSSGIAPASNEDKPISEDVNTSSLIDRANSAAERLEEANKQMAELINRQEQIHVNNVLGGTATAGTPQKSEEEKANEAARNLLKGSGFEDELFPQK